VCDVAGQIYILISNEAEGMRYAKMTELTYDSVSW